MVNAALLEFDKLAEQPDGDVNASGSRPRGPRQATGTGLSSGSTWAIAAGALLALAGSAAAARYYFDFGVTQPVARPAVPQAPVPAPHAPAQPTAARDGDSDGDETARAEPSAEASAPLEPSGTNALAAKPRGSARTTVAEDLLQRANQQRAAGEFRLAADSYALVYERFPKTLSGYVARVAGASLELEHLSNAGRARKLFEQALRDQPGGALDLEARQGLSMALHDLGDRAAERRALEALVATHKSSPAARRAEARIRELAGE
jgi:tetratricopeptide (TPR) repeat protein